MQASLQANWDLIALLGGDPAVIIIANPEVPDQRDLAGIVNAQEEGTVLVAFRGVSMGRRGNIPRFSYHFSVIYRAAGEIGVANDPENPDTVSQPPRALGGGGRGIDSLRVKTEIVNGLDERAAIH